jgi:hypothetical protein
VTPAAPIAIAVAADESVLVKTVRAQPYPTIHRKARVSAADAAVAARDAGSRG